MPLMEGSSKEVIAHNIKEMIEHGHPQDVAVAAAYASAGKTKKHTKKCYYCGNDLEKKRTRGTSIRKPRKYPHRNYKDFKSILATHGLIGNEKDLLKTCLRKFAETRNFDFLFLARKLNERGE